MMVTIGDHSPCLRVIAIHTSNDCITDKLNNTQVITIICFITFPFKAWKTLR